MDIFFKRLCTAREKKGLNKAEMARKLGFSPSRYQRYEQERMPEAGIIVEMSKILDVSADWLLGLSDSNDSTRDCESEKISSVKITDESHQDDFCSRIKNKNEHMQYMQDRWQTQTGQPGLWLGGLLSSFPTWLQRLSPDEINKELTALISQLPKASHGREILGITRNASELLYEVAMREEELWSNVPRADRIENGFTYLENREQDSKGHNKQ